MTVAQPVGDENTDSSPAALKLPRDVAGGWWWDQKPTGTKDRPHKCLHRPCETACKLWAVALSLGISCVFIVKNNLHQNCFFGRLHLLNINGSTFASHTFRSSA
ncbi:hypothetical protein MGG_12546 [Pyricularia oryzae 70-15]|uniref:Uncharacterized protein n=3 Tax=Pyricularia oryzae TaxID=318829 RepID=G4NL33_PYRO7|nr:uncharacterized protein MGG_12546 [Pyricularia oryzae 70-15]EHA45966.1 hypothetical protein MGG_12546 [Pyricularia oryzae 70-15]ELQ37702.1 hypothetical protein OOU_Y34scaffold00581g2 [Pyricularia oryzae Y34]